MKPLGEKIKYIRILSATIALLSLGLGALGAFVRATGAGLSCPDWPLCLGRVLPELQDGVAQELIHRYLAFFVGILSLTLLIYGFIALARHSRFRAAIVSVFLLLLAQVGLGALTVTEKLNPLIVTAHLGLGILFFQATALIAIELRPQALRFKPLPIEKPDQSAKKGFGIFQKVVLLTALLTLTQMLLGGLVGSSGAALVCPDLPFCFGQAFPAKGIPAQHAHMTHRYLGVILFVLSILLVMLAKRTPGVKKARTGHTFGIMFMMFFQVLLGALNIYLQIPIAGTVLHLLVAQMILLALASLYIELRGGLGLIEGVLPSPNEPESANLTFGTCEVVSSKKHLGADSAEQRTEQKVVNR